MSTKPILETKPKLERLSTVIEPYAKSKKEYLACTSVPKGSDPEPLTPPTPSHQSHAPSLLLFLIVVMFFCEGFDFILAHFCGYGAFGLLGQGIAGEAEPACGGK